MASIHQRVHRSENIQIFRRKSKSFFPLRKIPFGRPLKKRTRRNRMKGPPWRQHPPPPTHDRHTLFICDFFPGQRDQRLLRFPASVLRSSRPLLCTLFASLRLCFIFFIPLFVLLFFIFSLSLCYSWGLFKLSSSCPSAYLRFSLFRFFCFIFLSCVYFV